MGGKQFTLSCLILLQWRARVTWVLVLTVQGLVLASMLWGQAPDVGVNTPKKMARKHLVLAMPGFELGDSGKASRECMASDRHSRDVPLPRVLLAPQRGKFYGRSPVFQWCGATGDVEFEIIIRDAQGHELLRDRIKDTEYRLSGHPLKLEAGKTYEWSVRASAASGRSEACSAAFQVVPVDERKRIAGELASISSEDRFMLDLVRAQILTNHRLWYDAIGAYSDLIRRFPRRAELYEDRGEIYAQIGVTQSLADADLARADELRALAEKGTTTH
jgi:Domain of Unknown Function (DUF928)